MEFKLDGHEYIELKNLLKACGFVATGGNAKSAVVDGQVMVDGAVETRKGCKIRAGQTVVFADRQVKIVD